MTTTETCEHKSCSCTRPYSPQIRAAGTERIDPNATYCSRRCEEQARDPIGGDFCECGHPPCQAAADAGFPPMM